MWLNILLVVIVVARLNEIMELVFGIPAPQFLSAGAGTVSSYSVYRKLWRTPAGELCSREPRCYMALEIGSCTPPIIIAASSLCDVLHADGIYGVYYKSKRSSLNASYVEGSVVFCISYHHPAMA
jgi:hypothetical protein